MGSCLDTSTRKDELVRAPLDDTFLYDKENSVILLEDFDNAEHNMLIELNLKRSLTSLAYPCVFMFVKEASKPELAGLDLRWTLYNALDLLEFLTMSGMMRCLYSDMNSDVDRSTEFRLLKREVQIASHQTSIREV